MKLNLVCQQYATFRKALGERFSTEALERGYFPDEVPPSSLTILCGAAMKAVCFTKPRRSSSAT